MKILYSKIPTEKSHPRTVHLDQLKPEVIFDAMLEENKKISLAIEKVKEKIVRAASLIKDCLDSGGTLFFVGAGTSGRLGVIEAAELPPTFNTPPRLAQSIIAGGNPAVFRSQEGAEDNALEAARAIKRSVRSGDMVIGIAASGVTPFVQSALKTAKQFKAKTVLISSNPESTFRKLADIFIPLDTGPEILSGSTRLKAGTAAKVVLNMLTTIPMIRLGKVYGNLMVDLQPKSKKLRERGIRILQKLCGVNRKTALKTLQNGHWHVKSAILICKKNISYSQAQELLKTHKGSLRQSLK